MSLAKIFFYTKIIKGYLYKFTYINWFYTHKALYQTLGRLMYEIDAA